MSELGLRPDRALMATHHTTVPLCHCAIPPSALYKALSSLSPDDAGKQSFMDWRLCKEDIALYVKGEKLFRSKNSENDLMHHCHNASLSAVPIFIFDGNTNMNET